jgi:hypothetical protein
LFAETAIGDYHSSFANKGKQTSDFRFCLQQINGSCRFPLDFPYIYINSSIYIYIIYIYAAVSNGKRKWTPGDFPFIHLPFTHRANRSLSYVRLLMKNEETNGSYSFAKGLNGLNGLANL